MARILITGASGFLGTTLTRELAADHDLVACYCAHRPTLERGEALQLDITRADEVDRRLRSLAPHLVVHGAALSQLDACEREPQSARAVIVEGTHNVARSARAARARLVHISTDLVFDGKRGNYSEDDPVRGISVYARAKIEAEAVVAGIDPEAAILRVSVLYGRGNAAYPGFLDTVLAKWRAGEPMKFYTDQFRTPTFAPQVADAVRRLIERPGGGGLLHLGGADRLSRYEFAQLVAAAVGAPANLVLPGSMYDAAGAAPRGADCSLRSEKIRRSLGIEPMRCREGLRRLAAEGRLERISPVGAKPVLS